MKLSTLMTGYTPDASFEGFADSDTWCLAIKTASTQATPADYEVFQIGARDQSASFNPETKDSIYVRSGKVTTKTGNSLQIKLDHDRYFGDAVQDYIDSFAIVFGTGADVVTDFVYFNLLTGKGYQGKGAIIMSDGPSTGAGENGSWSGTLYGQGTPTEYTYAAA